MARTWTMRQDGIAVSNDGYALDRDPWGLVRVGIVLDRLDFERFSFVHSAGDGFRYGYAMTAMLPACFEMLPGWRGGYWPETRIAIVQSWRDHLLTACANLAREVFPSAHVRNGEIHC